MRKSLALFSVISFMLVDSAHAQGNHPQKKPVYVIVHGAWGGSWAFRKVDSLMTELGAIVYRPSLTGQGERVHLASADIHLTTHIQDVVNTILFEDLRDIILVGHSYGGMVITGVADRIPERIRKLVYLDAILPEDGESVMSIMDPKGDGLMKMVRGDYLVPPWVKDGQRPPKDVPHPLKTFTDPIVLKNQQTRKLPSAYILTVDSGKKSEEDDFAKFAERAKKRGWKMYVITADHNPQWSAATALVGLLMSID